MKGLPEESASARVDGRQWTSGHELAALQLESMDRWGRNLYGLMYQKFTGGKQPRLGEPLSIPRPGAALKKPRRRVMTLGEAAAFLNKRG